MYKLNKKGFAVTTVVYSILVLLILFMFILLAIVRGSYFNEKDFTKEVQVELDTYLKNMYGDYMKLPSEEQQKAAVHAMIFDTAKDYTEYLGV